jgi:hypothetical protein
MASVIVTEQRERFDDLVQEGNRQPTGRRPGEGPKRAAITERHESAKIHAFDGRCAYWFMYLRNPHMDHVIALGGGRIQDTNDIVPAAGATR